MDKRILQAAILVVSDTAARDPSTDKAVEALTEAFFSDAQGRWTVSETKIVPDDVVEIQQAITSWCDGEKFPNLVVTTGGTGFAIKDRTPEAITPLVQKHATGLV